MSVGDGGGGCSPCTKLKPPISNPDKEEDGDNDDDDFPPTPVSRKLERLLGD